MQGLEYVHSLNVVHCDIKLPNIFAHKNEESEDQEIHLKISDFGLSLILDPITHKAYMPLKAGTFNYLAPEVQSVHTFLLRIVGSVCGYGGGYLESRSNAVRNVRRIQTYRMGWI